jgi:hypothetical protein
MRDDKIDIELLEFLDERRNALAHVIGKEKV